MTNVSAFMLLTPWRKFSNRVLRISRNAVYAGIPLLFWAAINFALCWIVKYFIIPNSFVHPLYDLFSVLSNSKRIPLYLQCLFACGWIEIADLPLQVSKQRFSNVQSQRPLLLLKFSIRLISCAQIYCRVYKSVLSNFQNFLAKHFSTVE